MFYGGPFLSTELSCPRFVHSALIKGHSNIGHVLGHVASSMVRSSLWLQICMSVYGHRRWREWLHISGVGEPAVLNRMSQASQPPCAVFS